MERKWIGPNNYWIKYKDEKGGFYLADSLSKTVSWQTSHLSNWDEIDRHMKMNGYVEDLSHYSGGFFPSSPVPASQKRTGHDFIKLSQDALNKFYGDRLKENIFSTAGPFFNRGCSHEWTTYVGFMKTETYCTKCKEIQK